MARIALVDDDRNILTSLSAVLRGEGFDVDTYCDGQTALDAFRRRLPDLAILDVRMPQLDGIELLKQIRRSSRLPVIFLTSCDDEIDEILGLRMGADDYLTKPFSGRLLTERMRAVLRRYNDGAGEWEIPPPNGDDVIDQGALRMDSRRHSVTWKGCDVTLTVTEFLLLQALAKRPGIVKSRDQLMDAAYDDQVYVDDRTIDSHIKRLRKKLRETDPDFAAIETLYGVGYRYSSVGA